MTYLRPLGTVGQCSEVILIKRSVKTAHWALQNTRLRVILAFLKYRWASARVSSRDRVWGRVWVRVWGRIWDRVWGRVWDRVWGRVWFRVCDRVWFRVWDRISIV